MKLFLVMVLVIGLAVAGCGKEDKPAVDTSGAESSMTDLQSEADKAKAEAKKAAGEAKESASDALKGLTGGK